MTENHKSRIIRPDPGFGSRPQLLAQYCVPVFALFRRQQEHIVNWVSAYVAHYE
jgi:hypothetical protein